MKILYKLITIVVLTTFLIACSDSEQTNSAGEDTDSFTLEDKNINEVTLPDTIREVEEP